eukprot:scaffold70204_cov63-Phaeocystis_antarctica.AAC.3
MAARSRPYAQPAALSNHTHTTRARYTRSAPGNHCTGQQRRRAADAAPPRSYTLSGRPAAAAAAASAAVAAAVAVAAGLADAAASAAASAGSGTPAAAGRSTLRTVHTAAAAAAVALAAAAALRYAQRASHSTRPKPWCALRCLRRGLCCSPPP